MWSGLPLCGLGVVWVAWVSLGGTGFYWPSLDFTGCGLGFTGLYWTPLDPTGPPLASLEFTGIYWNC